jgi:hypothetical protein
MSFIEKTRAAWGRHHSGEPPDWVLAVAESCDASSLRRVAAGIGYSHTAVSLLLSGQYGTRDLTRIQAAVRRVLMAPPLVPCPVLGEIASEACRRNRALPFHPTNPTRVALYRACHGSCPYGTNPAQPPGQNNPQ